MSQMYSIDADFVAGDRNHDFYPFSATRDPLDGFDMESLFVLEREILFLHRFTSDRNNSVAPSHEKFFFEIFLARALFGAICESCEDFFYTHNSTLPTGYSSVLFPSLPLCIL